MAEAIISAVLAKLFNLALASGQSTARLIVGVEGNTNDLTTSLRSMKAVLADAEKRQVREELVKIWLEDLKAVSYDAEDVLDEWSSLAIKLQIDLPENAQSFVQKLFSCAAPRLGVVRRLDIGKRIESINERLLKISERRDQFNFSISNDRVPEQLQQRSTSIVDVSEVYGRHDDKEAIVRKLMPNQGDEARPNLGIISVLGLGGIGKTTLAQLAYNDPRVVRKFAKRIWVCVSDPFDIVKISRAVLEGLDVDASNLLELDTLQRKIQACLSNKKFLIVLDDVWVEDYNVWKQLGNCLTGGAAGSRILVTTRKEAVAKTIGSTDLYYLQLLSEEECWSLFKKLAFFQRSGTSIQELEGIGKEIAGKCKGLPLAAKTLGSLMRLKNNLQDWEYILNNEIWQQQVIQRHICPALLLSYYDLCSEVKRCFSYCAVFPKDYIFETDYLIKLWMAQNYLSLEANVDMEVTGRRYFEDLAMRSFFQDFVMDGKGNIISFKMHDIVHDFAQIINNSEFILVEISRQKEFPSFTRNNRHSTLIHMQDTPFPNSIANMERFHTILAQSVEIGRALPTFLRHLKYVRALDLSDNSIEELPEEIGALIHLRFLNLSANDMLEQLPDTVCNLFNLQTLKLSLCHNLETLPQEMGKLIMLRHLEIDETKIESLPTGIGRLGELRTLTKFIVSGHGDNHTCRLADLGNLNKLRGRLQIDELGNTANRDEAEKAGLKNKRHLFHLELKFSGRRRELDAMKDVAEALQPHQNLKSLAMLDYNNTQFPSWILTSLTQLTTLSLNKAKCTCLPTLGRLRLLETLEIQQMNSLRYVATGFLRMEGDSSSTVAFPMLKRLVFSVMRKWEKWQVHGDEEEDIPAGMIMPLLRSLTIDGCPKLEALPHQLLKTTLEELSIRNSCVLRQRAIECEQEIQQNQPLTSPTFQEFKLMMNVLREEQQIINIFIMRCCF